MDSANYYITTLSTAFTKLLPYFIFLVGGYFVFIRLPFLFFRKSMDSQKKKLEDENKSILGQDKKAYTVDDYREFQKTMKLINGEKPKEESKKEDRKTEQRKTEQQRTEQKRSEKKEEEPKRSNPSRGQTPEEIFSLRPNEVISKVELKKRYFELIKQNHPDRVASMGADFKKLAEKNTKEINKAYDKLKNKAA